MISYDVFRAILTMSITGSILAIILFALKPFVRHRLPKSTQYYLWIMVLVTLVVPISRLIVLPDSTSDVPAISKTVDWYVVTNQDITERVRPYETENADGFIGIPESDMAEVETLVPETWVPEAVDWFILVYFLGVVVYLAFICCSYTAFISKLKQRNTAVALEEHAMLAQLCDGKPTPLLYRNHLATTPMMVGVFSPTIILPDQRYTNEQLRIVLLHELTHFRRKDVLVKWISVFVTILHWFNPIVWMVRREIDSACELSCDEAVIRNLDADGKQNYGETLIYVAADAKTPHAVISTTMCEEKKALKERLGAIMKSKNHTRLAIIASAVLIVAVGGTAIAIGAGRTDSPNKPPQITIKSNNTEIFWVVEKDKWNGIAYDSINSFKAQQERIFNRDMPYIKNGEQIEITIDGNIPDTVTLTEHILNENGNYKYDIAGMTYDISFERINRNAIYTIKPNFATLLSSFSGDYAPGNTIKGYNLACTWGNNKCEYTFVILGDSATAEAYTFGDAIGIIASEHNDDLSNESDVNSPDDDTDPDQVNYNEIQQSVNNGNETWRLNPEEVASRYATQILSFEGETALYRNDGSEYARVIFTKQDGGEIHIDLYQPAKKGDGGIWDVEYWFDENSRMYQVRDLATLPPLFYNDDNVPIHVREAVRNAIVDDWTEVFGKHYQVLGFYANNVNYIEKDNSAELKFIMTLVTQNFYKDPDTVGYIKEAKDRGSSSYQQLYEEYNMPKSGSIDMKVTMSLDASGEVGADSIQTYSNISPHGEEYVPSKAKDFIISE